MKNFTKLSLGVVILIATSFTVKSQTNVSGGIYSNTTWTLANSPYIVTDTIVVFPNVTLTIEPGVIVKFANKKQMEIRQGRLIAIGTAADSIIFTSNSPSPVSQSYAGIYLNGGDWTSEFSYCSINYATTGLASLATDSLIIHHSSFSHNQTGVQYYADLYIPGGHLIADSSTFSYNSSLGMTYLHIQSASVNACSFFNNDAGLSCNTETKENFITDCIFRFNTVGLGPTHCTLNRCTISHNQKGASGSVTSYHNCVIDSNTEVGIIVQGDSLIDCSIRYNVIGIKTKGSIITGCVIEYNSAGGIEDYTTWVGSGSNITKNIIRYSNIGIHDLVGSFNIEENLIEYNTVGIVNNNLNSVISCNKICNNATYDLKNETGDALNATQNDWCTSDSADIASRIYDGYDNISYGLVTFQPVDQGQCNFVTAIEAGPALKPFSIFPNPAHDVLTIGLPNDYNNATIKLFNVPGELVYTSLAKKSQTIIDISRLANGVYIIELTAGTNSERQKFIKQ